MTLGSLPSAHVVLNLHDSPEHITSSAGSTLPRQTLEVPAFVEGTTRPRPDTPRRPVVGHLELRRIEGFELPPCRLLWGVGVLSAGEDCGPESRRAVVDDLDGSPQGRRGRGEREQHGNQSPESGLSRSHPGQQLMGK